MFIKVSDATVKSQSHKVNRFVRLQLEKDALDEESRTVGASIAMLRMTLTGGQLAEAERILNGGQ